MRPDLTERVRALLSAGSDDSVASGAYPTARVARLRTGRVPLFPEAADWLLAHQWPDGSWGGRIPSPHDRTACTLAAVVALAERQAHELPDPDPATARAVAAGCGYLARSGGDWRGDEAKTLGFDLVVPALVAEARQLGLELPWSAFEEIASVRDDKLRMFPCDLLSTRPTTLLYSLEAVLPVFGDHARLGRFLSPDGAMAGSPSATAGHWSATGDPACLGYLRSVRNPDGGYPEFHPLDVFSRAWTLHHLQRAGLLGSADCADLREAGLDWLHDLVDGGRSVGFSTSFPLPDPDSTAMCLNVLADAGREVADEVGSLLGFEGERCFFTYPYERYASVTPNARVLQALGRHPGPHGARVAKVVDYLLAERRDGAWWRDKWHLSTYYATANTVFGLSAVDDERVTWRGTGDWLLDTQHGDGSWGLGGGNPEESACAVLALDALAPHVAVPGRTWRAAEAYLREHLDDADLPELWVGKGLYTPVAVARSAVLAGHALAAARLTASPGP